MSEMPPRSDLATMLKAWPTHGLRIGIRFYRYFLSPWLGSQCRFTPTCSAYALEAVERHGASHGSYLAARRLWRCRPGCSGGHDPVPCADHQGASFHPPLSSSSSGRDISDIVSNPGSSSS